MAFKDGKRLFPGLMEGRMQIFCKDLFPKGEKKTATELDGNSNSFKHLRKWKKYICINPIKEGGI